MKRCIRNQNRKSPTGPLECQCFHSTDFSAHGTDDVGVLIKRHRLKAENKLKTFEKHAQRRHKAVMCRFKSILSIMDSFFFFFLNTNPFFAVCTDNAFHAAESMYLDVE